MTKYDFENYNREWLLGAARLLQIRGEPIPEELIQRADKLGLHVSLLLFGYEEEK